MDILQNYSLKALNTFGLDARARYFANLKDQRELFDLFQSGIIEKQNYFVLGGGSNVLFTSDFDGLILKINNQKIRRLDETDEYTFIEADAGVNWHNFVEYTLNGMLGGLENLSLIPGNVGAAPIQNIGAYGVEQEALFSHLKAFDLGTGRIKEFKKEECSFGYRDSIFKSKLKGRYLILSVVYRFSRRHQPNIEYAPLKAAFSDEEKKTLNIKRISEIVCDIRRSKLPDPETTGNAGSFFKNPVIDRETFLSLRGKYKQMPAYQLDEEKVKVPAGWLIEQCGWKGKRIGNAGVHDRQALVLVNYGSASGKEIYALSESIKNDVNEKFGISLEREVNVI